MNPMIKQLVIQKMSHLTTSDLIQLGHQFGLNFSHDHAKKIVTILKANNVDVFDMTQRKTLLKEISKQVNPKLARDINSLINQFL